MPDQPPPSGPANNLPPPATRPTSRQGRPAQQAGISGTPAPRTGSVTRTQVQPGSSSVTPAGGSQTNWNDVLRYSSPIGVVKTDIVYGVYNTSGSKSSSSGTGNSGPTKR